MSVISGVSIADLPDFSADIEAGGILKKLLCGLRFIHQRGIINNNPMASPVPKAAKTTITNGAFQNVPKKKLTAIICWLFSAKAKSVKKMAALSSHIR